MTRPLPRPYLIGYDIADKKRLSRVHAYVKERAMALQYSVFLGVFDPRAVDRIVAGLAARIDPRRDDVRLYALERDCRILTMGEPVFPTGIALPGAAGGVRLRFEPYAGDRGVDRWGLVRRRDD